MQKVLDSYKVESLIFPTVCLLPLPIASGMQQLKCQMYDSSYPNSSIFPSFCSIAKILTSVCNKAIRESIMLNFQMAALTRK